MLMLFIFFGPLAVARRILWNRIWLSLCQSVRLSAYLSVSQSVRPPKRFLVTSSLVFSKFWHDARNIWEVVSDRARFFFKRKHLPQKWAKNRVLLENLVINFSWIWSIMKVYIVSYILAQILYLRKIWFLRYGQKCSWPIRLQDF